MASGTDALATEFLGPHIPTATFHLQGIRIKTSMTQVRTNVLIRAESLTDPQIVGTVRVSNSYVNYDTLCAGIERAVRKVLALHRQRQ